MSKNVSQAFDEVINRLSAKERIRNGKRIQGSLNVKKFIHLKNSITLFTKSAYKKEFDQLSFADMDKKFLQKYIDHIMDLGTKSGNNGNITDKIRRLKHVFSNAGVNTSVFDSLNIPNCISVNPIREFDYSMINQLRTIDRTLLSTKESFYLDLFLFSCYSAGLSIAEMSSIKQSDIQDDIIHCMRTGTTNIASIPFIDLAKGIIGKYKELCYDDYSLPIFTAKHKTFAQQEGKIKRLTKAVNYTIQRISGLLGLKCHITMNMTKKVYISKMIICSIDPKNISLCVGCSFSTVLKYMETVDWDNLKQQKDCKHKTF